MNKVDKILKIFIAVGIWLLVLQNFNVFGERNVKVKNSISIWGTTDVRVENPIDIGNTVDINISEINGMNNVFYKDSDGSYMLLPVTNR